MVSCARYFKIALAARPLQGAGAFSWRCKEALEACGHTVFLFAPALQPWLFEGLRLRHEELERFVEVQGIDLMLCADGVLPDAPAAQWGLPVGLLVEGPQGLRGREGAVRDVGFEFGIAAGDAAEAFLRGEGLAAEVIACAPVADRPWTDAPLANDVAFERGLLCLQDATPERVARLGTLVREAGLQGLPVRCLGAAWPEEWRLPLGPQPSATQLPYAARSSMACVAFGEEEGAADPLWTEFAQGLLEAVACPVVSAGSPGAAEDLRRLGTAEGALVGVRPEGGATLEDELAHALGEVAERASVEGRPLGSPSPRRVVMVLGYFGMGNFGDEYILQTIDERLRAWHEGASVVAVSEDAAHTLRRRGVYAMSLRQKAALDGALAYSSAALVVAGLLFDQGIRWTMGKAELVSSLRHSDVPGIAAFCLLASLNDTPIVFYGIGAGPLEVPDGRALVRLIGRLGALFLTRDEGTAQLLRGCGVASPQVIAKADTAFLGAPVHDDGTVSAWLSEAGIDLACHQLLAVSLRDYENLPEDFAERVARVFDAIAVRHPQVRFALCVLDPSDEPLAERIMAALGPSTGVARVFDPGDRLERLCALLVRAHGGFSMRYHCSLILNSHGIPCVGVGYLPKVASLYEDMGCGRLLLPVGADETAMEDALEDLLGGYEAWSQVVGAHAARLRSLSEQAEGLLHEQVGIVGAEKEGFVPRALFLESRALAELELLARCDGAEARCAEQRERAERAERERDELLASRTFRLGDALMRAPRALKGACSRLRPGSEGCS